MLPPGRVTRIISARAIAGLGQKMIPKMLTQASALESDHGRDCASPIVKVGSVVPGRGIQRSRATSSWLAERSSAWTAIPDWAAGSVKFPVPAQTSYAVLTCPIERSASVDAGESCSARGEYAAPFQFPRFATSSFRLRR